MLNGKGFENKYNNLVGGGFRVMPRDTSNQLLLRFSYMSKVFPKYKCKSGQSLPIEQVYLHLKVTGFLLI